MIRREVSARFRRLVQRVLSTPDPIALALHERGLGPKPEPYIWGSTKVVKHRAKRNGAGAAAEADFGPGGDR